MKAHDVLRVGVFVATCLLWVSGCGDDSSAPPATPVTTRLSADANTVGLWHFNEGSGQTVADASGNGWDLTLGSNGTAESIDPAWATSGRFGRGLAFTASETDYVSGPGVAAFGNNQITVEFWIKTSSTDVSNPAATGNICFTAQLNSDGRIQAGVGDGSSSSGAALSTTAINDDQWHYVAVVYDGTENSGSLYLYIDGSLEDSITSVNITLADPSTWFIGGRPSGVFVDGRMDEFRVSDNARPASEIADNN
ncbi:MAG: LamG domain-containing protein [Candidatus Krumholzibacteria bacterium]|nr:LamG domain-containing protein [Candidatus Krumholzibacteria bacterium]